MDRTPKCYSKRTAILDCLRATGAHPSAETVHQMLLQRRSDISLATVYRNLALFKQQGVIQSLGTVGGAERFDYNTAPHVHFICQHCHAVIDLPALSVPEEMKTAAEAASGGRVEQCGLHFSGICRDCCAAEAGTAHKARSSKIGK